LADPSPPHEFLAAETDRGERADRFFAARIGTLSRSRVKALIEEGHAREAGAAFTDPARPIRPGVAYSLAPPPPLPARPQAQDIPLDILFEDQHLIVLDKPAGLVVHPAPGNLDGTLVNALLGHAGEELEGIGGEKRPGIVHRLDKDTSGVMVVAKTERAHRALSEAFAARDLEREYLALVWGVPNPAAGEVDAPIGRHQLDRKRMAVVGRGGAKAGKTALTRYRTEQVFHGGASLLRCKLATGRTHQIRVHLTHMKCPLIGDPVYGATTQTRLNRLKSASLPVPEPVAAVLLQLTRQALHAAELRFLHPSTGAEMHFTTPLPEDLETLENALLSLTN